MFIHRFKTEVTGLGQRVNRVKRILAGGNPDSACVLTWAEKERRPIRNYLAELANNNCVVNNGARNNASGDFHAKNGSAKLRGCNGNVFGNIGKVKSGKA